MMIMECRPGCAACCIAPSITSPIPGMPNGKPAGVACVNLNANLECTLFNDVSRPEFCSSLQPAPTMCGENAAQAMFYLESLEDATR